MVACIVFRSFERLLAASLSVPRPPLPLASRVALIIRLRPSEHRICAEIVRDMSIGLTAVALKLAVTDAERVGGHARSRAEAASVACSIAASHDRRKRVQKWT